MYIYLSVNEGAAGNSAPHSYPLHFQICIMHNNNVYIRHNYNTNTKGPSEFKRKWPFCVKIFYKIRQNYWLEHSRKKTSALVCHFCEIISKNLLQTDTLQKNNHAKKRISLEESFTYGRKQFRLGFLALSSFHFCVPFSAKKFTINLHFFRK